MSHGTNNKVATKEATADAIRYSIPMATLDRLDSGGRYMPVRTTVWKLKTRCRSRQNAYRL
jgi:hypothetical protein